MVLEHCGSHFTPLNENEKGGCDFFSHNYEFISFKTEKKSELQDVNSRLRQKSQNCDRFAKLLVMDAKAHKIEPDPIFL